MLKNRILYILTALCTVGFSMAYMGKTTHFLVFVVLLYPAAALALTAIQLILARVTFSDDHITSRKNTEFDIKIQAFNRFIFPSVPMELLCEIPDAEVGVFAEKRLFISLPPLGNTEITVKGKHLYRGSYTSRIKRLYVTDPLRIIRLSKRCEAELPMMFIPRVLFMEDLMSRSAVEQSLSQRQLRSADKEDFSHVRDYRDGDIMQMVHWKLTAKQDEIMIKQFDSVNDLRALILCEYKGGYNSEGMLRADMFIETAIAFARAALDKGISSRVDLGLTNDNAGASDINDMGSWNRFYELMSVLPPVMETKELSVMLGEADVTKAAILAVITDELTQELLEQIRNAAAQVTVFLAFLNLDSAEIVDDFSEENFFFLNIEGTEDDAVNAAVEKVLLSG